MPRFRTSAPVDDVIGDGTGCGGGRHRRRASAIRSRRVLTVIAEKVAEGVISLLLPYSDCRLR